MKEIIYILIGIGMIYAGYFFLKKNLHLQKNGIRTIAKVISTRYVGSTNHNSDTTDSPKYSSTVEFKTEKNQTIVVELDTTVGSPEPIGTERKIIYDPQFPEKAKPNNTLTLVIAPCLFAACGIFLVVWGVLEFMK